MISNESRIKALRGALNFLVKIVRESEETPFRKISAEYMVNVLDADDSCARMIAAENERNSQLRRRDSSAQLEWLNELRVRANITFGYRRDHKGIILKPSQLNPCGCSADQPYLINLGMHTLMVLNAEIKRHEKESGLNKESAESFNNENLIKGSDDL